MINAKLQSIIDTKSAIGNAIVNKGGTITGETPFFNYAAQIDGISSGTPQTIFAASDGSKWAFTNVVNLTNVGGNITHDFNRWQTANNSTSDPILNGGTVFGNISGNIRIVQVNQVNTSQYGNIVINDTTGAKYVGYNGYDAVTNPTPTDTATFNRWLLNNSASGTVLFANTTVVSGGTFNSANTVYEPTNMAFIGNTTTPYNLNIYSIITSAGFVYVAGGNTGLSSTVFKYNESNLGYVGDTSTVSYSGIIRSISSDGVFIYIGGTSNQTVLKFRESNLQYIGFSNFYPGAIQSVLAAQGYVFVGRADTDGSIQRYFAGNLVLSGNFPVNYGGHVWAMSFNSGNLYVGGATNQTLKKYNLFNFAFVGNTVSYGGTIRAVTFNNGFIYVGGETNQTVQKFYDSNLAFVGNTPSYNGIINTLKTNNGFIYVGGASNQTVQKFYESNLTLVANTANYGGEIRSLTTNNGFIYVGGFTNLRFQKFQEAYIIQDNQTFYTATKIKE